ncbi:type II toxin-antitoxin system Phd/YefM family antitoxin [Candidatus Enterococcus courvalinii]|uniref:Type II toxin-antitoxin system Phd/YefM family antitoxin n=1 Tax=Candidatus Enterococcus courvalinii TaxID=2815329 RepID=A0ABS3HZ46_9ENTE|nr:type II toxin-antitoxin system Phd/YefM family antitoxin [Enterococcus sp. MSG2901]MBO0481724.1 type II toxin-antitoxin system Phd/YefM family antitoxin [Enterococcus sp. MSG2901]
MELKKLEVPTSSITEVKRSPMDVFAQAREAGTGVYIFNREKVAGVMLTQEQYEALVQELDDLREQKTVIKQQTPEVIAEVKPTFEPTTATNEPPVTSTVAGMEELVETLQKVLITGMPIVAKNLDERMVSLGFITKKTGFGGVVAMLDELNETGKISYQLRKRQHVQPVIAEIIGEQEASSPVFDKLLIKKIYIHEG